MLVLRQRQGLSLAVEAYGGCGGLARCGSFVDVEGPSRGNVWAADKG